MREYAIGFQGDGLYQCSDGWENGESEFVCIETPKGPSPQKYLCYSKNCLNHECNYSPYFRENNLLPVPQKFPEISRHDSSK